MRLTRRFLPKTAGSYPSSLHASCYAGVPHYLRTVAGLGPARAKASGREAVAAMKRMPTDDDCFGQNSIRADGRFLCPVHLFQATTPADKAWRPLSEGTCAMVHA